MANLKFFKGTNAIPVNATTDGNIYFKTDSGIIQLLDKKWYAGGEDFTDVVITTNNNALVATFTKTDGTTKTVTLLNGINGDATNMTIDNNGDITVDVVVSKAVATGNNILINDGSGLYSTIKAIYESGSLQLQYYNGTAWANVGDAVDLLQDSFLAGATFVKNQAEFNTWTVGKEWSGITATISEPSIVFVMREESTSGITYEAIVVPTDDLYKAYTFQSSSSVTLTAVETSNTVNVTANVNLSTTDGDNILVGKTDGLYVPPTPSLSGDTTSTANVTVAANKITTDVKKSAESNNALEIKSDGLFVATPAQMTVLDTNTVDLTYNAYELQADVKITATQGDVTLTKESDGLKAALKINSTTPSLETSANGVSVKLAPQPDETTGGVVLEKTANGLTASLIWGEF